jgi:hypothetical protein
VALRTHWKRWTATVLVVVVLIAAGGGALVWWKFFKSDKQQLSDDPVARFAYGSLDGELLAGIPYPIFMILPRVFPDLVAKYATEGYGPQKTGFGGYGAFGLAWDEGQRLPFGLSIKRLGHERVTINCALCHTASYRLSVDDQPRFAVGGPAHTLNLQGLLRFLIAASHDERFSATRLIPEISVHFPLDWLDWADYATVLIPATRTALHLVEGQLGWMNEKPAWGPGRDDAFNLPKYSTQTRGMTLPAIPISRRCGASARARVSFITRPARRSRSTLSLRPRRSASGHCRPAVLSSAINGWKILSLGRSRQNSRARSMRASRSEARRSTGRAAPNVTPKAGNAPARPSPSMNSVPIRNTSAAGTRRMPTA